MNKIFLPSEKQRGVRPVQDFGYIEKQVVPGLKLMVTADRQWTRVDGMPKPVGLALLRHVLSICSCWVFI